jgi:shikimate dehydrogenase
MGAPVAHSLSPAIFTAAFAALGLDWSYAAYEVDEGGAPAFLVGAGAELDGVSVTMPHKAAVLPALDVLSPVAQELGAVNCIVRVDGSLHGHNTDGDGLVDALRIDEGIAIAGQRCVVVGAGGAGRAVARALGASGARDVVVVNRSPERAAAAAALAGAAGRVGDATAILAADVVVNATPLGMGAHSVLPFDPAYLDAGQVVVDLIYHPEETPLLAAAAGQGARVVGGLGMLVHQAGHQLRLWTGAEPPLAEMHSGARAELAARRGRS